MQTLVCLRHSPRVNRARDFVCVRASAVLCRLKVVAFECVFVFFFLLRFFEHGTEPEHISSTNHFWVNALVASPNAYAEHYASVTFSGWHLEHCNECTFIAVYLTSSHPHSHRCFSLAVVCMCVCVCVLLLLLLLSIDVVACHSVIVFNRNSIDYRLYKTQREDSKSTGKKKTPK